jgi:hypothetical protein
MASLAGVYQPIIASVLSAGPARPGVEAALAQILAQAPVAPAAAPEFPFPRNAEILAELTDVPAKWPEVIDRHILDFVLPQRVAIPGTAVAGVPGAAKVSWNTTAKIDQIVRPQSAVTFAVPPTNGLPLALFDRFDSKLHFLQPSPGSDIAKGWQLLKDFESASDLPASAQPATKNAAMQAIKQLAAFEGFCIRLAAAIMAADRADVSLAEALALWRTEGDLLTPYSEMRFSARAPTCDVAEGISLGRNTAEIFFSMKRGLWTLTYIKQVTSGLPADAAQRVKIENKFRLRAFKHWALVTAGLDFLWQQVVVDLDDRTGSVAKIAGRFDDHHDARGLGRDLAARKADCDRVLDDLACRLPAATTERVIVTPSTPAKLVGLLLGEALILAELDTVSGKGPYLPATPKLKYLAYHCQDHRDGSDPMQDKYTLMLVSAAVAAARGPAGALKTSLASCVADPSFPRSADLAELNFEEPAIRGDTSGHAAGFKVLKDKGWWDPANLDSLADFILLAGSPAPWRGWEKLRGNMARYVKLRAYYEALLS